MNKILSLLMVCFCAGLASGVQADKKADVQKLLQASYNKSNIALSHHDVGGVLSIYDDGYVRLNAQGEVEVHNKSELRQRLLRLQSKNEGIEQTSAIQSVVLEGSSAIVTVQNSYTKEGSDPEVGTDRDFWQRVGKRWLLKRSHPID